MSENIIRISNVLVNGSVCQCQLENGVIAAVAPELPPPSAGCKFIDGTNKALLPAFYNTHTHAAMTLLRGYADDMELFRWLNECIWPFEAKLTADDIYLGTRLAMLEMIRSGTVFFNDMYWHQLATVRAAEEIGMRAAIGLLYIEGQNGEILGRNIRSNTEILERSRDFSSRIQLTDAPHAIYTVSEKNIRKAVGAARSSGRRVHIHVSETSREVEDCRRAHNGMTPVEYLDSIGAAGSDIIYAHAVHITDRDMEIMAEGGTVISHCPCSNYKLASGAFPYAAAGKHGCRITLGTDGCSSNNNLAMGEEMKFAALNAKIQSGDPTAGTAAEIWRAATLNGAEAFGINGGVIAPGRVADCLLVNLQCPEFIFNYDMASDMVYANGSSAIDTVICDGRILMEDGVIPGSDDILAEARDRAEYYKKLA